MVVSRSDTLKQLCEEYSIAIFYVFGSRAKEVAEWLIGSLSELPPGPGDVDVGVKPAPGMELALMEKLRLTLALEDFFGVPRVDLISIPEADPFLAANIIRGERLHARDSYEADEYDLYILRRAGDLMPLERERIELILGETS